MDEKVFEVTDTLFNDTKIISNVQSIEEFIKQIKKLFEIDNINFYSLKINLENTFSFLTDNEQTFIDIITKLSKEIKCELIQLSQNDILSNPTIYDNPMIKSNVISASFIDNEDEDLYKEESKFNIIESDVKLKNLEVYFLLDDIIEDNHQRRRIEVTDLDQDGLVFKQYKEEINDKMNSVSYIKFKTASIVSNKENNKEGSIDIEFVFDPVLYIFKHTYFIYGQVMYHNYPKGEILTITIHIN